MTPRVLRRLAALAVMINGLFPAEQVVSNRWSIRCGDLPKVAAAFGLAPAAKASKPTRAPRAAVEHAAA